MPPPWLTLLGIYSTFDPFAPQASLIGGGIYVGGNCTVDLGDVTAIDNEAALRGGAIYVDGDAVIPSSRVTICGDAQFYNNSAQNVGGAVAVDGSEVIFKGAVTLKSSRAMSGAAVWTQQYPSGPEGRVVFNGPFCAQDNVATTTGAGSVIQVDSGGIVEFSPSADAISKQNAANNTAPAIVAVDATVSCGAGSSRQQPAALRQARFVIESIEGPVCRCITGGRCTCPATTRWIAEACTCAVSDGCGGLDY